MSDNEFMDILGICEKCKKMCHIYGLIIQDETDETQDLKVCIKCYFEIKEDSRYLEVKK